MKCNLDKNKSWQHALTNAITEPSELIKLLELDEALIPKAHLAAITFPLKVPRGFVARMKKGDVNDPLLQQVLPLAAELETHAGYETDPLREKQFNPIPGLLHKYPSRVLLTPIGACGINCRYCFRRHFAYEDNNPGSAGWEKAIDYIAKDPAISEVILSGGDPLVANDSTLASLTQKLIHIPHIKRLRIHTRMLIVLPERITEELITAITHPTIKTILVTHCNHPQEINSEVVLAAQKLKKAGVILLNQTVLLKGINDHVDILAALSEALFSADILPYYLHILDKVQGAAHFDLALQTARTLHQGLIERLSGYLVPKLVCEQPGAPAKVSMTGLEFCTE